MKTIRKLIRRVFTRKLEWKLLPTDIFLVSYPRSGNTWMRYLLANLFAPEEFWHIDNIGQMVPDIHQPPPEVFFSTRIIKSHLPFQADYAKVIYLYRDGRDVAISYFDFLTKIYNYKQPFDTFFSTYLANGFQYGTWHEHMISWHSASTSAVLPVQYERLVNEPLPELQKVTQFLGMTWREQDIQQALERSSISKIRQDYQKRKFDTHWQKGFTGGVQATPGHWRAYLTDAQNEMFWAQAGGIAAQVGYQKE
jgi:hypothetical protein